MYTVNQFIFHSQLHGIQTCIFWNRWMWHGFLIIFGVHFFIYLIMIDYSPKSSGKRREKILRQKERWTILRETWHGRMMCLASHWPLYSESSSLSHCRGVAFLFQSFSYHFRKKKIILVVIGRSESQSNYAASTFTVAQGCSINMYV